MSANTKARSQPWRQCLFGIFIASLLSGCGSVGTVVDRDGPGSPRASRTTRDAVPKAEPRSKYGNPESYEVFNKRYYTLATAKGYSERGVASWYGKKFHGRKTSSGEMYDMYQMTAAHKTLPLPTYVQVKNLENQRTAILKVNDRGPFHDNRIIDLSYAAALKLGVTDAGTAFVEVRALDADGKPTGPVLADTAPAAGAPDGVYMQVGAFQDAGNAHRLADRIAGVVANGVHVRQVLNGGRTLHRVQIGPIASVEIADSIVFALAQFGISKHHFVSN